MSNDQPSQSVIGLLSHIDLCVCDPVRSIAFYDVPLTALGYERWREEGEEWREPDPQRATWDRRIVGAYYFGIDLRPASAGSADRRHDRYGPGPHHPAFHVSEWPDVDRIHNLLRHGNTIILDPPTDYGGRRGYGRDYYALFFEDPDGVKLEVVCAPGFGPSVDAKRR